MFPISIGVATTAMLRGIGGASASFTRISALIASGGIGAVPWHLAMYTVPAVIIGGQTGPRLRGKVPQAIMERGIGVLLAVIGFAMLFLVYQSLRDSGVMAS